MPLHPADPRVHLAARGHREDAAAAFQRPDVIGSLPWVIGLTLAGEAVGANWKSLERHLHVVDYAIVVAIIAGLAWLVVRNVRGRGDSAGGTATE